MGFSGDKRGPDVRVTAKSKATGDTVTIGAAWIDDGNRCSLKLDREVVGILVVTTDGRKHKITTGKEGTHYINMFLNFIEDGAAPKKEESFADENPFADNPFADDIPF